MEHDFLLSFGNRSVTTRYGSVSILCDGFLSGSMDVIDSAMSRLQYLHQLLLQQIFPVEKLDPDFDRVERRTSP